MLHEHLQRTWWALILRGLAAIVFGVVTIAVPGITFASLVFLFGAFALIEGVIHVASAIWARKGPERWWALVLQGAVSIGAGLLTFVWPGLTALALVYVIAAWALITGALEISTAIRLRKQIRHEALLGLSGIVSIALGVFLFLYPGAVALAMVFWIGAYAVVFGLLLVALAVRLRLSGRAHWPTALAGGERGAV